MNFDNHAQGHERIHKKGARNAGIGQRLRGTRDAGQDQGALDIVMVYACDVAFYCCPIFLSRRVHEVKAIKAFNRAEW